MKPEWLPAFFASCLIVLLSACRPASQPSGTPPEEVADKEMIQQLSWPVSTGVGVQADTLFFRSNGFEYYLLWKGDTLTRQFSYDAPVNCITALGALGFGNVWLLRAHMGDGCPFVFQLLTFDDSARAHISEVFGNCNDAARVEMQWPRLSFVFDADPEIGREGLTVRYDVQRFELQTDSVR